MPAVIGRTLDYECSCAGKYPYQSRCEAERAAKTLEVNGVKMNAYRCHYCGFWHFGHAKRVAKHRLRVKGDRDWQRLRGRLLRRSG